jgi:hypothetical protein
MSKRKKKIKRTPKQMEKLRKKQRELNERNNNHNNKGKKKMNNKDSLITNNTATELPKTIGENLKDTRAINLSFIVDGKTELRTFSTYTNKVCKELGVHNKENGVDSQKAGDLLLEKFIPEAFALKDDRLDWDKSKMSETKVYDGIVSNLSNGLCSLVLSNPYWNVWKKNEDVVLDINVEIDDDWIGINQSQGCEEYGMMIVRKGIDSVYESVKNELDMIMIDTDSMRKHWMVK